MPRERTYEILGVSVLGLTTLLFLALATDGFDDAEHAGRYLDGMAQAPNLLGPPGAIVAGVLAILIGDAAHILYAIGFVWGLMLFTHRPLDRMLSRFAGLLLLICAMAALLQVNAAPRYAGAQPGGIFGAFLADRFFMRHFGTIGTNVVGFTMVIIGVLLATDFLFVHILVASNRLLVHLFRGNLALLDGALALWREYRENRIQRKGKRAVARRERAVARREHAAAPRERAAQKQEVRQEREKDRPSVHLHTEDLPFLEPGVMEAPETAPLPAPPGEIVELELPFDAVPDIEDDRPSEEDDESRAAAFAEEPVPTGQQMDLMAERNGNAAPPDSEPKRHARRARRKTEDFDELPEGYVYPRRFTKPALDLFDMPEKQVVTNLGEQLRETSVLLEETLLTFGIEAQVTDVTRGPTITRFELEPAPGVKVSRFMSLADDIALALKAHRVRVEAPIPGKGRVGIEVPNVERDQVLLRESLENWAFKRSKGKLKLALGKDISGDVVTTDLAAMPHLLVAGATGAGKTVCVKALLASLLCQKAPDELQLILIDPKMVELSIFNDIPHLITPVVTDPKKAATALTWLINEMEERYRLFADLRVRNIEIYNESVENGEIELEPACEGNDGQSVSLIRRLPYIVCIIDELADLMMLARAEVEDAIARLAQLARAVGIHLIIATQRPSVDVLTGVIKANFPARISFQVSSRVDSRCILDEIGAERLIGMGDMLYLPAGQSKPYRIQGAFVSDMEMNALVRYLKTQAPPQYRDEIENFGKTKESLEELTEATDPLFDEAVQVVLDTGQASISMVQRRLRVGYTRAARLIDMMELRGIVGPHMGSKAREILIDARVKDDVA